MLVLVPAAFGQAIPDGDFEATSLDGWTDASNVYEYVGGGTYWTTWFDTGTLQALPARGATSLLVQPPWPLYNSPLDYPILTVDLRSTAFVVTRQELHYARITSGLSPTASLVDPATGAVLSGSDVAGAPSVDPFLERVVDTSGACGWTAVAKVFWAGVGLGLPSASLDDLALAGALCDQYVDGDGDGLCPYGADLDLDGDCEDAAELSPVPVDCDDTSSAVGACLVVEASPSWIRVLDPFSVTVSGANPGERVSLIGSFTEGPTCPPVGACLDVGADARVLDRRVADADGNATFTVLPRRPETLAYETAILQAVAIRPAGASIHSGALRVPVRPEAPRVAPVPGLVNGDFDVDTAGWSLEGGAHGSWMFYDDFQGCPDGVVDPAVGRGGGALYTELPPGYGMVNYEVDCVGGTYSLPVRLTHQALTWAQLGAGQVEVTDLATRAPVLFARSISTVAADGFVESVADVSAGCGMDVVVEVTGADTWWDDLALDGPLCEEYRDRDGDGLCPDGVDLDGDHACVSAGEPTSRQPLIEPLAWVIDDISPTPSYVWSSMDGPVPHVDQGGGDYALLMSLGFNEVYWEPWTVLPYNPGSIVTYDTLAMSVAKVGTGDWYGSDLHLDLDFDSQWSVPIYGLLAGAAPGIWRQERVDVSPWCGQLLYEIAFNQSQLFAFDDPEVWFDDLGYVGEPCPEFVDTTSDGRCAEGLDLDGDGLCVGAGEPTPGVTQDPAE